MILQMLSSYSMKSKEMYTTPTASVFRVVEMFEKSGRDASGNLPVFIKPKK